MLLSQVPLAMQIRPETKFNQIVGMINDLRMRRDEISQFEVAKLKREAKPIQGLDPVRYYVLIGMINCLAGDIAGMRENHERAIKMNSALPSTLALKNYAVSLGNTGFFAESLAYYEKAYRQDVGSIALAKKLVESSFLAGRFLGAQHWIAELRKLTVEKQEFAFGGQPIAPLEDVIAFVRRLGIRDDVVSPLFDTAIDLLHEHGIHSIHPVLVLLREDKNEWLSVHNQIDATVSTIVDLNVILAERIEEKEFSSDLLQVIVIQYACTN